MNNIGIDNNLDLKRIRKLMYIGLFAALLTLVGDMLLGYGMSNPNLIGLEGYLSKYDNLSDTRIFLSAFFGLIGIPLDCLSYFSVYRLIACKDESLAHKYRSGIFGTLIFGACGVHVPCLACVFVYKYFKQYLPDQALEISIKFGTYFLLPAMIIFMISFFYLQFIQIKAFISKKTPYPKWCFVFNIIVGMIIAIIPARIIETPITNAISAGWINVGIIWMYMGLLMNMKLIKE